MINRISTVGARSAAVILALGLVVTACGGSGDDGGTALRGSVREPAPNVAEVSLPDGSADGADFSFQADEGELLLVYFGYTSCPDVCPTTLADVRNAVRSLDEADADRVTLAMATVDPERDTPEVLTGYVQTFVPGGHALVTDDYELLTKVGDAFGASFGVETGWDGEPVVEHTGFLYAVDDAGRIVVTWPFGMKSADMAHDIEQLLPAV